MARNRRQNPCILNIRLRLGYTVREPRNRYTHIRSPNFSCRTHCLTGISGIVPGLPQPISRIGAGRPLEISTAVFSSDLRQTLSLFSSVGFSAMKFQNLSRCNFEIRLVIIIDGFDLSFINKFDSGNRDTELYGCYYGIDCRFDIRKSADSRCDRFRYAI